MLVPLALQTSTVAFDRKRGIHFATGRGIITYTIILIIIIIIIIIVIITKYIIIPNLASEDLTSRRSRSKRWII